MCYKIARLEHFHGMLQPGTAILEQSVQFTETENFSDFVAILLCFKISMNFVDSSGQSALEWCTSQSIMLDILCEVSDVI